MPTNWTKAVSQDSFDGMNTKIGASTDGESQPTLFGKMLGMRNVVDWVKNTWTAAKAGLLDVAVSTRAPASTALSTATWTSTRAAKLDNLDASISTRATQASVNALASSLNSGIKSVQGGVVNFSQNSDRSANISSVNMYKSIMFTNAVSSGRASGTIVYAITSATTVSLRIPSIMNIDAYWTVIEFN